MNVETKKLRSLRNASAIERKPFKIVVSLNVLKRKMLFGSTKNPIDKILVNGTIRHSILTKLIVESLWVAPKLFRRDTAFESNYVLQFNVFVPSQCSGPPLPHS